VTPRVAAARAWIADFIDQHGYAPSTRELGEGMSVSVTQGHSYLLALEEAGAIRRQGTISRGYSLVVSDSFPPTAAAVKAARNTLLYEQPGDAE